MKPRELKVSDVVQISPELPHCFFRGCFMVVTEPKPWGAQGFISIPVGREELPGRAYFRCKFEDMEYVGSATWVIQSSEELPPE